MPTLSVDGRARMVIGMTPAVCRRGSGVSLGEVCPVCVGFWVFVYDVSCRPNGVVVGHCGAVSAVHWTLLK